MSEPKTSHDQEIAAAIAARAAVDRAFRTKLLADPRSAVSEVLGHPLPASFRIKFIEKDASLDALVVLPDLVPVSGELSVEELEAVAGGLCWDTCGNSCGVGTELEIHPKF